MACNEEETNLIKGHTLAIENLDNPIIEVHPVESDIYSDLISENAPDPNQFRPLNLMSHHTISISYEFSAVITPDGSLWSWGYNRVGQLGHGTTDSSATPMRVGIDTDWVSIATGSSFAVALREDGSLWGWGADWDDRVNLQWPLAFATITPMTTVPTQIGIDTDWASISAGSTHIMALRSDGSLWSWGWNDFGQLGTGTTENSAIPIQVGTDTDWASVIAGDSHTLALKTDGSLWAWGWNDEHWFGEESLDSNESNRTLTPIQIGIDTDWVSIATGGHIAGIKADGSLWTWGRNSRGQLGDGTTTNRLTPAQVGTDTNWISVVADAGSTLAIKEDGSLWAWGHNSHGLLGVGTTDDELIPTQIGTDTDWVDVAIEVHRIVAIKEDGSVWSWGQSGASPGNLIGDDGNENRYSPVKILEGNDLP